jgi:hypothetical protein
MAGLHLVATLVSRPERVPAEYGEVLEILTETIAPSHGSRLRMTSRR